MFLLSLKERRPTHLSQCLCRGVGFILPLLVFLNLSFTTLLDKTPYQTFEDFTVYNREFDCPSFTRSMLRLCFTPPVSMDVNMLSMEMAKLDLLP